MEHQEKPDNRRVGAADYPKAEAIIEVTPRIEKETTEQADHDSAMVGLETTTDSTTSLVVGGEATDCTTSEEEEDTITTTRDERHHRDTENGCKFYISEADVTAISRVSTSWFGIALSFQIAMGMEDDELGPENMIRRLAGRGPISEFELIGRYIKEKGNSWEDEKEITDEQLYEHQCEAQDVINKLIQNGELKEKAAGLHGERLLELEPD